MPCTVTTEEKDFFNTLNLINFLCKKLNKPKMNGSDFNTSSMAPYLCSLIKGLTEEQLEKYVYNARDWDSRRLADWWETHQLKDSLQSTKTKNK